MSNHLNKIFLAVLIIFTISLPLVSFAFINGLPASDLIGQYDGTSYTDPQIMWTKGGANDGPNKFGFNTPTDLALDSTNHRLFVSDRTNNRVLVYNLSTDNTLPDRIPDNVLGQDDFLSNAARTTVDGMNTPTNLAYDSTNQRLFVSERGNNRITIFDVTQITNGQDAINELGQEAGVDAFNTAMATTSISGLSSPYGLAYDSINSRLFVSDYNNHRVLIFDVALITNGEDAINVIGQDVFTTNSNIVDQDGIKTPVGVTYDSDNKRLFVGQSTGCRVTVYSVDPTVLIPNTPATDGPDAINVIGQTTFTGSTASITQSGVGNVYGVFYEPVYKRLFVSQNAHNRISIYNTDPTVLIPNTPATDGPNAINVLGQTLYTTSTAATTQIGLSSPVGMTFDSTNNKLFVAQTGNHRISIFDVALIENGESAVDLLGQYDGTSYTNPVSMYIKGGANDGPNNFGFSFPQRLVIDSVNHRFFVSDDLNNRILIYNLDSNDNLLDYLPDNVLGQSNFYDNTARTTQVGLSRPMGLSFDSLNNRLFVSDYTNSRVLVYDLSDGITNGEGAVNVLGQTLFTTNATATSQIGMRNPWGLSYDSANQRLFVADRNNHRITVYDLSDGITNGEGAVNVLGQTLFTTNATATSQTGMNNPRDVLFADDKLFVLENTNNRVTVFDLSDGITNGEGAANVLGQVDFNTNTTGVSSTQLSGPIGGLAFDSQNSRLFIADGGANNRVLVYDLSDGITNGEAAVGVVGQQDFNTSTASFSRSSTSSPIGLFYDSSTSKLFVTEYGGNRISIFNLTTSTPSLTTTTPTEIQREQATLQGSITNVGNEYVTKRGFEYGEDINYTETRTEETVNNLDEAESFTAEITNLKCGTTYHYRSYAINLVGTGYSSDSTFNTEGCPSSSGSTAQNRYDNLVAMNKTQEAEELKNQYPNQITPSIILTQIEEKISQPLKLSTTKLIKLNTKSNDVKLIQIYLNTHGYPLATKGVGSLGHETTFFGKLTKQAVMKFQKANRLRVDGVVGEKTREKMK